MSPAATLSLPRRFTLSPSVQGTLWGLSAVSIWGIYLAVARANVGAGILPVDIAFVRYATAGLVMLPWLLRHWYATRADVGLGKAAVLTALAGPLFILVGASGFAFAPLSHGSVIQPAAITIGGLLFGAVLLGDAITRRRLVGTAIILSGLLFVAGPAAFEGGRQQIVGDMLFASAGLMWALFAVLSRRWSVSPIAATAIVSVLSALVFSPLFLAFRGIDALMAIPVASLFQLIVFHGLLSGVIAVFAFGRAVQLLGAARAAAFPALVPVVATLSGVLLIGEVPAALQILGLLVTTAGLVVSQTQSPHVTSDAIGKDA